MSDEWEVWLNGAGKEVVRLEIRSSPYGFGNGQPTVLLWKTFLNESLGSPVHKKPTLMVETCIVIHTMPVAHTAN